MSISSVLEYLRTQGVKPKDQVGKGRSGTVTGKIMPPRKSVKEQKAAKRKADFEKNRRAAGMDTDGNPYRSKKQSTAKVGDRFGATKTTKKATGVYPKTKGAYTIQKGDTLSGIAKKSGTTVAKLMALNPGLKDPNKIRAGAGLNLAPKGTQAPKRDKNVYSRKYSPRPGRGGTGDRRDKRRTAGMDDVFKTIKGPYDEQALYNKGGKVVKAVKGQIIKKAVKSIRDIKPLTAAQNRARLKVIREKEAPARARLKRIKDKAEARRDEIDDIKNSDPGPKLSGVDKFKAKKMGVNTKGKTPDQVRFETREKLIEKEISAEKSAYEPRFNSKGGMLKTPPAGKKGKGLRKLPTAVRNKMGYKKRGGMLRMSGGGSASGFGRAAMRPGKDPRSISKT